MDRITLGGFDMHQKGASSVCVSDSLVSDLMEPLGH